MFQKRTSKRSQRRSRRGVAAVEFAIVAPIFLLFLMGIIDISRMVMAHTVLTNASREGARIGIVNGTTAQEIEETARRFAEAGLVSGATVSISVEQSANGSSEFLTVELSVPLNQISWSGFLSAFGDRQISSATTMRKELY